MFVREICSGFSQALLINKLTRLFLNSCKILSFEDVNKHKGFGYDSLLNIKTTPFSSRVVGRFEFFYPNSELL